MLDANIKAAARTALQAVPLELMRLYTRYALLLNALDVTRKEYEKRDSVTISTTINVPQSLRLPVELDVQLGRKELIEEYGNKLLPAFCSGFLVELVSHFDAWMEGLYDQGLPLVYPTLSTKDVERKVRSAWTDTGGMPAIRRSFLVDLGLKAPAGKISTPAMVFDRYEEMREIRHAIIHSGGRLTAKNVRRLQALSTSVPTYAPAGASTLAADLLSAGLNVGSGVVVGPIQLLRLRQWAFQSIVYFEASFQAS